MSARGTSFSHKATAAWGPEMPDWVRTLAAMCDEACLRKVAAELDVSPASVSLGINKARPNLEFLKERVERLVLECRVECPVMGDIARKQCLQEQAAPFSTANPLRMQIYRACRSGCPNYKERTT